MTAIITNLHVTFVTLTLCLLLTMEVNTADGENLNEDGSLTYADLPTGDPYTIVTGEIDLGSFPLTTTWNIIDGFLKFISPAGPPYDLILEMLVEGNLDITTVQSRASEFKGNFFGFIFLFIFGLVFAVLFAILLFCFCCCRLCGNCGGKMEQVNSSSFECLRLYYSVTLLVTLLVILFGSITALAVSNYTSAQVTELPSTITDNIQDMLTYVSNTVDEINFLAQDQLRWTLSQVSDDLNDVADLVGVPVRESLRPAVEGSINAVYAVDAYIVSTLDAMKDVDNNQNALDLQYDELDAMLIDIFNRLTITCGACGCCAAFNYTGLSMNADYRDIDVGSLTGTFPQDAVNLAIDELQGIVDQSLTTSANVGLANFENIPITLSNTTAPVIESLLMTLEGLQGSISNVINSTTAQLLQLNTEVDSFQATLNPVLDSTRQYDQYRDTAMSVVFGFILFVACLFLIGLMLGIVGHCLSKARPADRSGMESCGGCVIMIAAIFAGILIVPFMLISSFTFIIGGPIDRLVCDPIISKEIFIETIDRKDALVEGYYLGDLLFQDSSINITISGMLDACENNIGIYTAFQLEHLFNISQFTNIDKLLGDVDGQFGNITGDFSEVIILTGDTRDLLTDFRESSTSIPWENYLDELNKDVTNDVNDPNDLSVLAGNMRVAAASLPQSDRTDIEAYADELDNIQNNYISPLIDQTVLLTTKIYTLTNYTEGIDSIVNETINAADEAQVYINENAAILVQDNINGFQTRVLGYPYQYAEYVKEQITKEVGRCLPVFNLYYSSVNTFCVGIIQAFNGFWYCLGLCTFMFVFAFIFGVKSAKFYRRMTTDVGFESDNNGYPMSDVGPSYGVNKVAPDQYP